MITFIQHHPVIAIIVIWFSFGLALACWLGWYWERHR